MKTVSSNRKCHCHQIFNPLKTLQFCFQSNSGRASIKVSPMEINNREAAVRINNDGMGQPVKIRVKRYPLFEKGKEINLCIHPDKMKGIIDSTLREGEQAAHVYFDTAQKLRIIDLLITLNYEP